jgi:hypothetical protein
MGRSRKQHRQQHGSAWHWTQTDCWYDTPPGTKKRMPLWVAMGAVPNRDEGSTSERITTANPK